jgi:hypothetical protein
MEGNMGSVGDYWRDHREYQQIEKLKWRTCHCGNDLELNETCSKCQSSNLLRGCTDLPFCKTCGTNFNRWKDARQCCKDYRQKLSNHEKSKAQDMLKTLQKNMEILWRKKMTTDASMSKKEAKSLCRQWLCDNDIKGWGYRSEYFHERFLKKDEIEKFIDLCAPYVEKIVQKSNNGELRND